jgi:hypothetical protein
MMIRFALALSGLALVLSTGTSYSGPCAQQIINFRAVAREKLGDIAEARPAGNEAQAEVEIGDISAEDKKAFFEAFKRANVADKANDLAECEKALAKARRILDQVKR